MLSNLTSVVNQEALAQDEAGIIRVTLKLNSNLRATRHDPEPFP